MLNQVLYNDFHSLIVFVGKIAYENRDGIFSFLIFACCLGIVSQVFSQVMVNTFVDEENLSVHRPVLFLNSIGLFVSTLALMFLLTL